MKLIKALLTLIMFGLSFGGVNLCGMECVKLRRMDSAAGGAYCLTIPRNGTRSDLVEAINSQISELENRRLTFKIGETEIIDRYNLLDHAPTDINSKENCSFRVIYYTME